jgi:hypothetical protein
MLTQQRQLVDHLSRSGWRIIETDNNPLEWWIDEQWIIESEWSPQGVRVCLMFVVDPQWEGERKKGEGVWAIQTLIPTRCGGEERKENLTIPLRPQWEKRLPSFISALNTLRNEIDSDSAN